MLTQTFECLLSLVVVAIASDDGAVAFEGAQIALDLGGVTVWAAQLEEVSFATL